MNEWFRKLAHGLADAFGSPWAFVIAAILTIVWAVTGPLFVFPTRDSSSRTPSRTS